jgi:hypothetical protein
MAWFVCSVVGGDAGEGLDHILIRKEAERSGGAGEFWWGLGAALGPDDGVWWVVSQFGSVSYQFVI